MGLNLQKCFDIVYVCFVFVWGLVLEIRNDFMCLDLRKDE